MQFEEQGRLMSDNLSQYVTFYLDNELFGIAIEYLQEIIRVPQVVKVPRVPPYIRGLANLRGNVLTIVDCRRRLGLAGREDDELSRVIVLTVEGRRVGYVVDRIAGVVSIDKNEIEKISGTETAADFLEGVAKIENRLLMLLSAGKLLTFETGSGEVRNIAGRSGIYNKNTDKGDSGSVGDEQVQLISFKIGNEEYGIEVEYVQEIVRASQSISEVPNAPEYIMGIFTLRNRVLPIISVRSLFCMEEREIDERSRVIVTYIKNENASYTVGLCVDAISEVLRIDRSLIEPVPAMLKDRDSEEVSGICKLEEGRRLVYMLNPEKLFDSKLKDSTNIIDSYCDEDDAEMESIDRKDEEIQLVSFLLGEEEFAFPIEDVREIIRLTEIVAVPKAPSFVEGVINLRGAIVPVIDLRKKFELGEGDRDDRSRIVVVEMGGKQTGLIVDSVKEVLKVKSSNIEPAPDILLAKVDQRFISGIAKLDEGKRMVIILDTGEVLSTEEKRELAEIGEV